LCDGSIRAAAITHDWRPASRWIPYRNGSRIYTEFREHWFLPKSEFETWRRARPGRDNILVAMQWRTRTDVRRIPMSAGNAPAHVWRILHGVGSYPHHPQRVQNLLRGDPPSPHSRVQFCELLQPTQLQIASDILSTDQAHFTRDGINSTTCYQRRQQQNPQGVVQSNFQQRFSVNVWYRILGKCLRGLHVIELLSYVWTDLLVQEFYTK